MARVLSAAVANSAGPIPAALSSSAASGRNTIADNQAMVSPSVSPKPGMIDRRTRRTRGPRRGRCGTNPVSGAAGKASALVSWPSSP